MLAAAMAAAVLAACGPGGEPDLEVGTARASPRIAGASQVVVDITNHGTGDDTLVGATTPAALGAEIHLTEIADGRATMGTLAEVTVRGGETVRFRPGGMHLMLTVPDESVEIGGTFPLTLRFDRSGDLTVTVQVVANDELLEPVGDDDP